VLGRERAHDRRGLGRGGRRGDIEPRRLQGRLADVHVCVPEPRPDVPALEVDHLEVVEPCEIMLRHAERPDAAIGHQHIARWGAADAGPAQQRRAHSSFLRRWRPSTADISAASAGCE
jgi:hypothetical protein